MINSKLIISMVQTHLYSKLRIENKGIEIIQQISKLTNIPIVNNLLYLENEDMEELLTQVIKNNVDKYVFLLLFNLTQTHINHLSIHTHGEILKVLKTKNQNSPYIEQIDSIILMKKLTNT